MVRRLEIGETDGLTRKLDQIDRRDRCDPSTCVHINAEHQVEEVTDPMTF